MGAYHREEGGMGCPLLVSADWLFGI